MSRRSTPSTGEYYGTLRDERIVLKPSTEYSGLRNYEHSMGTSPVARIWENNENGMLFVSKYGDKPQDYPNVGRLIILRLPGGRWVDWLDPANLIANGADDAAMEEQQHRDGVEAEGHGGYYGTIRDERIVLKPSTEYSGLRNYEHSMGTSPVARIWENNENGMLFVSKYGDKPQDYPNVGRLIILRLPGGRWVDWLDPANLIANGAEQQHRDGVEAEGHGGRRKKSTKRRKVSKNRKSRKSKKSQKSRKIRRTRK